MIPYLQNQAALANMSLPKPKKIKPAKRIVSKERPKEKHFMHNQY
jgi:hypothetical protein